MAIRSEIALPELQPAADTGAPDIEIICGPVEPGTKAEGPLSLGSGGIVLTVKGVARFLLREGRSVVVDAAPDTSERNVRLFLLGSAMGVLLHQRGIVPLHANAIEFDGRAIAFLGHSGAGKSTLAAIFHDRGHRILSDDVCAVTRGREGFVVQPGIPRLRLWRDAVERSGREVAGYERALDAVDKYTVGTDSAARAEAAPLGAVYLLRRGETDAAFAVRPLSGVDAAQALIENTYRGAYIRTVGNPAAHFATCLALSRAVPVFELVRPWNTARIDETMAQIEAHLGLSGRATG